MAEVPRHVVAEMVSGVRFRSGVDALARELGRPFREVADEARAALVEMAAGEGRAALGAWHGLERVAARAYRLDVDTSRMEGLRRLDRQGALVFLPSHRSYLDPLVLREALRREGFGPNRVLGGINVAFWPIGSIGRRAGYVFIRRLVRNDPVYRFVLKEYVRYLVARRRNLEWYLEGGRTRTGHLRAPRLGLLAYLVRAYRAERAAEVYLVPVSIVYDLLYELGALADEEHGAPKPPESLGWALRYFRAQGEGLGRVHVRFGEPLALAEVLPEAEPAGGPGAGPDRSVEKVAFEVCHRIDRITPVTPTALVSLALAGARDRPVTAAGAALRLRPFLAYLTLRGIRPTGPVDVDTAEGLVATLEALTRRGALRRERHSGRVMWSPARPFELAFYANGIAPHFLDRALVELIAAWAATTPLPRPLEEVWAEALRLRRLLEFEFVFASKPDFAADLRDELELFDPIWEQRGSEPGEVWSRLTAFGLCVAPALLRPTFVAYRALAAALAARGDAPVADGDGLVSEALAAGNGAVAAESLRNAVRLAGHRGLLGSDRPGLAERREAFAREVDGVLRRLDELYGLATGAVPALAGGLRP